MSSHSLLTDRYQATCLHLSEQKEEKGHGRTLEEGKIQQALEDGYKIGKHLQGMIQRENIDHQYRNKRGQAWVVLSSFKALSFGIDVITDPFGCHHKTCFSFLRYDFSGSDQTG